MSIEDHKKNNNLRLSYRMAIFNCCLTGFTQNFFTPFLLLFGGTAMHVGIMSSCNNLFASLFQSMSAELSAHLRSRKKVIAFFILLQSLTLLAVIAFGISRLIAPGPVIIAVILFTAFGAFTTPGWLSLLSDMVEPNRRGTYFGWRSRNLGFITVGTTFLAGLILQAMTGINQRNGFFLIFSLAACCGFISWLYLKKMTEPPLEFHKEDDFTFFDFIRRYKDSNFVRFVLFVALMNFCVNLAAPYFSVLMLQDLRFNYFLFTLVNTLSLLMLFATVHRWGRHADIVGNITIIKGIAPFFCCSPLLWIINQNPVFLITVEMLSGFLWAGFSLCTSNFIIDAVTPAKRTRCVSYFTLINGLALAAGAFVGGHLLRFLPIFFHYKILTLFLLSGVLRLGVALFFPVHVTEVRTVKKIKNRQLLLSILGIKPLPELSRSRGI